MLHITVVQVTVFNPRKKVIHKRPTFIALHGHRAGQVSYSSASSAAPAPTTLSVDPDFAELVEGLPLPLLKCRNKVFLQVTFTLKKQTKLFQETCQAAFKHIRPIQESSRQMNNPEREAPHSLQVGSKEFLGTEAA
jgi:hypothetical protein